MSMKSVLGGLALSVAVAGTDAPLNGDDGAYAPDLDRIVVAP